MDRGAWRATVHEVAKSRTRLSDREGAAIINAVLDPADVKVEQTGRHRHKRVGSTDKKRANYSTLQ